MNIRIFKKKQIFFSIIIALCTHSYSIAQSSSGTDGSDFFEHVRFGGSLGASFTNDGYGIFLAPKAIYDFNQFTSAGVGLAGSYTSVDDFSASSFSGSLIGLLRPVKNIQLSAEFEENYVSKNWELEGANRKDSYWYPALFLGLGYTAGPVTAGIRYDILYDDTKSIYGSALMPFISVYF
ncbi:alpha-ketoglutarate decarboxylase [Salinimicrobium gaetbulicola]|uniref:Alpha-ketoglutarate decarboxylase n=1 Tax=Salinimicrobium gaetbulicola TaxID=999702 RepID=A0ABW3IG05_9FLAO